MRFDWCRLTHAPGDPGVVAGVFVVALVLAVVAPLLRRSSHNWVRKCATWSVPIASAWVVAMALGVSKNGVWQSTPPCGIEFPWPPMYPMGIVRLVACVVTLAFFLLLFREAIRDWVQQHVARRSAG